MKVSIFLKIFLILPLILFVDYLIMALLGCTTCLLGFGEDFYCGSFCLAGKIILALSAIFFGYLIFLALSAIFFGYLIFPEIKAIFEPNKHGTSA